MKQQGLELKLLTPSFRLKLIYIVVYSAQLCFPARWFASI